MEARRSTLSMIVFLGPPVAWAVHLMVVYPLVPLVCSTGHGWLFWLAHLATLAPTIACIVLARRMGRQLEGSDDRPARRARFFAWSGVWMGLLFGLAIVVEAIPTVLQDPCR